MMLATQSPHFPRYTQLLHRLVQHLPRLGLAHHLLHVQRHNHTRLVHHYRFILGDETGGQNAHALSRDLHYFVRPVWFSEV